MSGWCRTFLTTDARCLSCHQASQTRQNQVWRALHHLQSIYIAWITIYRMVKLHRHQDGGPRLEYAKRAKWEVGKSFWCCHTPTRNNVSLFISFAESPYPFTYKGTDKQAASSGQRPSIVCFPTTKKRSSAPPAPRATWLSRVPSRQEVRSASLQRSMELTWSEQRSTHPPRSTPYPWTMFSQHKGTMHSLLVSNFILYAQASSHPSI